MLPTKKLHGEQEPSRSPLQDAESCQQKQNKITPVAAGDALNPHVYPLCVNLAIYLPVFGHCHASAAAAASVARRVHSPWPAKIDTQLVCFFTKHLCKFVPKYMLYNIYPTHLPVFWIAAPFKRLAGGCIEKKIRVLFVRF